MSSNGYYRAQLAAERRRQLQLEQLTNECRGLLSACESAIQSIIEPAVQQIIAPDLQAIRKEMNLLAAQVNTAPEQAKKQISQMQKKLNAVISSGQAKANQWSRQQAEAQAQLQQLRQSLTAQQQSANQASQIQLTQVQKKLDQATTLYQQRRYDELACLCRQAEKCLEQAGEKVLDETVRREVMRGLLSTLGNMGFVLEKPVLEGEDPAHSVVKLTGRLPSGRMARFEVNLDGRMAFDFDGYEGRACAKDLETIGKTLQERFAVKLEDRQITWKNPDKIAKGARNLPTGGKTRHV